MAPQRPALVSSSGHLQRTVLAVRCSAAGVQRVAQAARLHAHSHNQMRAWQQQLARRTLPLVLAPPCRCPAGRPWRPPLLPPSRPQTLCPCPPRPHRAADRSACTPFCEHGLRLSAGDGCTCVLARQGALPSHSQRAHLEAVAVQQVPPHSVIPVVCSGQPEAGGVAGDDANVGEAGAGVRQVQGAWGDADDGLIHKVDRAEGGVALADAAVRVCEDLQGSQRISAAASEPMQAVYDAFAHS